MAVENSNKRETILIIITAITLILVFIFITIIDPQLKKRKVLSGKLSQLQLDLTRAKCNLMIKDRIERMYAQIEPMIAVEGSQQQQISNFTRLLDQTYSKLGMKIKSVKILPVTDQSYYQKLSIKIEMTGFVKDFLKFVEAIEKHKDPVKIEQLELTCQETTDAVLVSVIVTKIVSKENNSVGKI